MVDSAHIQAGSTVDPAEIERFSRIAGGVVGPARQVRAAAPAQPGAAGLHPRPRRGPLAARSPVGRAPAGPVACSISAAAAACSASRWPGWAPRSPASTPPTATSRRPALHAGRQGLAIDYRADHGRGAGRQRARSSTSCWRWRSSSTWPTSTCSCTRCSRLAKPGGLVFLSTLNRTAKAWALAIAGAEYVLRWLPRGTHDWRKFLKPSEAGARPAPRRRRAAGDRRRGLQPDQPRVVAPQARPRRELHAVRQQGRWLSRARRPPSPRRQRGWRVGSPASS